MSDSSSTTQVYSATKYPLPNCSKSWECHNCGLVMYWVKKECLNCKTPRPDDANDPKCSIELPGTLTTAELIGVSTREIEAGTWYKQCQRCRLHWKENIGLTVCTGECKRSLCVVCWRAESDRAGMEVFETLDKTSTECCQCQFRRRAYDHYNQDLQGMAPGSSQETPEPPPHFSEYYGASRVRAEREQSAVSKSL